MTYSELFLGRGIFNTVFYTDYPTQYTEIFGDTPATKLDAYAVLHFGDRETVVSITEDNYKDIVSSVIAVNVDGWVKQAKAMQAEYDVTKPTVQDRTLTEQTTTNETGNGTDTSADIPFNETDFSDRDKNTKQDEKNRTEERTTTEKISGVGSGKTISTEIEKELRLRRDIWRKNIIFALVNELTLDIYQ